MAIVIENNNLNDGGGGNSPIINIPKSTSGEVSTIQVIPEISITSQYGILDDTSEFIENGGNITHEDGKFIANVGDNISVASILTRDQIYAKGGMGCQITFDAIFDTPQLGVQQAAGFINSQDSFSFAYINEDFGVVHYYNGKDEALKLTILSSGTGNATITIDGIGYPVTLTSGNESHNASEIANQLIGVVPNYLIEATKNEIFFLATLPEDRGSFSFIGSSATVSFTQEIQGSLPIIDFIPMTAFNGEDVFTGFNPLLLNNYKIIFDGNIHFYIQNAETSEYDLIHTIKYLNTSDVPHTSNPTFRGGWLVRRLVDVNTNDVKVQGSKLIMSLQGEKIKPVFQGSAFNSLDFSDETDSLITIRNKLIFNDRINRSDIFLEELSITSEATRAMYFEVILNPVFVDEIIFDFYNKNKSIAEISLEQVEIASYERILKTESVSRGNGQIIDLRSIKLKPSDTICIACYNSRNTVDSATGGLSWDENL